VLGLRVCGAFLSLCLSLCPSVSVSVFVSISVSVSVLVSVQVAVSLSVSVSVFLSLSVCLSLLSPPPPPYWLPVATMSGAVVSTAASARHRARACRRCRAQDVLCRNAVARVRFSPSCCLLHRLCCLIDSCVWVLAVLVLIMMTQVLRGFSQGAALGRAARRVHSRPLPRTGQGDELYRGVAASGRRSRNFSI
jgi:hypothetical protein